MKIATRASSFPELDVTPMIGVLVVLLIVVMTTPPAMKTMDAMLWSRTPGRTSCLCDDFVLVLEVLPRHVYLVNEEPIEPARLLSHLTTHYPAQAEKEIIVEGYPGVSYADVVTAIDIAKSAGARTVEIPPREAYLPTR